MNPLGNPPNSVDQTTSDQTTSRGLALLAIFAHPDDEVLYGGLLANAAARGARVTLAVATRGEAGRVLDPAMAPVDDLPALRVAELRRSCESLGIAEPRFLGFHDSGRGARLRHDDPRALANVDFQELTQTIVDVIASLRPQVVVTHEPLGGYYHPDHMAVHRAVTAAFFAAGSLGREAPQRLLYGARGHAEFLHLAEALRGRGVTDGLDANLFGAADAMIALDFDATPYLAQKRGALAAHRSQFGLTIDTMAEPPAGRPAAIARAFLPLLSREVYLLGGSRVATPRWPLSNAFDGIEI